VGCRRFRSRPVSSILPSPALREKVARHAPDEGPRRKARGSSFGANGRLPHPPRACARRPSSALSGTFSHACRAGEGKHAVAPMERQRCNPHPRASRHAGFLYRSIRAALASEKNSGGFIHPLCGSLILPPIPSPEGALSGPPGSRGEGAAPAPVGARQARRLRGKRSRSSRGSLTPPLRHYDRSALEAEKVWNGDLQTPCGSAGEARLYNAAPSRRSLTPRPVPGPRPGGG